MRYISHPMKRPITLLVLLLLSFACRQQSEKVQRPAGMTPATTSSAPVVFVHDPHSYSNPTDVRVEHIDLDLVVDFARKQLRGTARLRVRNVTRANKLVLDTNGLDVRMVSLEPPVPQTSFHLGARDPILGTPLEIAITPETTTVVIQYGTSPDAKALQWLDPVQTASKKSPFLLSQSEAILARTWVPLQDSPQVRFTYDATL